MKSEVVAALFTARTFWVAALHLSSPLFSSTCLFVYLPTNIFNNYTRQSGNTVMPFFVLHSAVSRTATSAPGWFRNQIFLWKTFKNWRVTDWIQPLLLALPIHRCYGAFLVKILKYNKKLSLYYCVKATLIKFQLIKFTLCKVAVVYGVFLMNDYFGLNLLWEI